MGLASTSRYAEAHAASLRDPESFWGAAAAAIDWVKPPARVLDASRQPFYRWFPGAELNVSHNALDRHVANGRADQLALVWDSPMAGAVAKFTYRELRDQVALFAGALARLGAERYVVYGVVTEYCVRFAVLGLLRSTGARVELVTDAVKSLARNDSEKTLADAVAAGAVLTTVARVQEPVRL